MEDRDLMARIDELVEEEHRLEREHAGSPLEGEQRARMERLEVELDKAWDLLRQRRARRHAGEDAADAQPRSERTVEGYLQ